MQFALIVHSVERGLLAKAQWGHEEHGFKRLDVKKKDFKNPYLI